MTHEVPEGWKVQSLGDIATLNMGQSPKSEVVNDEGIGLPFFQGNAEFGDVNPTPKKWTDAPLKTANAGDILFSVRAPVGEMNVALENCCIGRGLSAICANGVEDCFLLHALSWSKKSLASLSQGSTFTAINKAQLSGLQLLVPPSPEQKKIGEVLSSVDEAIVATKAVIDQTKQVKKGLLQTLLTKGIGHTKFKQTELGEIPESWEYGSVSDFFVLQRGFDLTKKQAQEGNVPVISSSGFSYFHNISQVHGPTVITGRKGKLGDVYYIETPCWPHDTTLWVKDFKGNHPRFVYWFLLSMELKKYDAATAVPTLNRNTIHPIKKIFPPLEEQIEIADKLDSLNGNFEKSKAHLSQLQILKSGLMSDLLKGKKRVEV